MNRSAWASPNIKKIKRVVQGIVDQILNEETSLIGLTTIRDYDEYTFTHSVNVCIFSVALGKRLGLSKVQLYDLGMAALFHDIGKSRVPQSILNKTGGLTDDEWRLIAAHPWLGVLALFQVRGAQELPYRAMIVAHEHHMKRDLTGYPRPIRARQLSVFSKIVAIADGFDAATSRRVVSDRAVHAGRGMPEMRDNPEPRHGPGRSSKRSSTSRASIRSARWSCSTPSSWHRPCGQSAPGDAVAADRAYRLGRPGQRPASRAHWSTSPIATPTACSSAQSSKLRILIDMASGSATISSDAHARERFSSLQGGGEARARSVHHRRTSGRERTVELLQGARRSRRGRDRAWAAVLGSDGRRPGDSGQLATRARAGNEFRPLARAGAPSALRVPLVLFSYLNPIIAAGERRAHTRGRGGVQRAVAHRPAGRSRSGARGVGRRGTARVHSTRRADDAARAHARDRRARQRVRVSDQPTRRHGNARRLCRPSLPATVQRLRDAIDAAGVRRLWRLRTGTGRGGRANRRRRRRRQRDRSRGGRKRRARRRADGVAARRDRRGLSGAWHDEITLQRHALSRARRHSAARANDAAADRGRSARSTSRRRGDRRLPRAVRAGRAVLSSQVRSTFSRRSASGSHAARFGHSRRSSRGARRGAEAARRAARVRWRMPKSSSSDARMIDVAYIALGSNVGDRHAYLARARARRWRASENAVVGESSIEETAPIGPIARVRISIRWSPLETALVAARAARASSKPSKRAKGASARAVGAAHARSRHRMLSIIKRSTSRLRVPHPELANRDFWQRELAELRGGR